MASRTPARKQDNTRTRITILVACSLAAILVVAWISRPPAESTLARRTPGPVVDPPVSSLGAEIEWQMPEVYVPRAPDPTRLTLGTRRLGTVVQDARITSVEPRVKTPDPTLMAEEPNTRSPDPNARVVLTDPNSKPMDPNAARAAISAARVAMDAASRAAAANVARAAAAAAAARAAAEAAAAKPVPPPPPPPVLDIRGVVFSQEEPLVIIGTEVLHEGDSVSGVKIMKIHKDRVDLQDETRTWTQSLVE